MSKFKTGDLVRYIRPWPPPSQPIPRLPEHIEWRDRQIGLILSESSSFSPLSRPRSLMYNVLWNDDAKPLIVPEWDLELVPNEI